LTNSLNEVGDPFGDDVIGKTFAAIYYPGVDQTMKFVTDIHDGFTQLRKNFEVTATNYDNTETQNSR
jgi:hypothetical protein